MKQSHSFLTYYFTHDGLSERVLLAVYLHVQDLFDSCEGGFPLMNSAWNKFISFFYSPNLEENIEGGSKDSVTPPTLICSLTFKTIYSVLLNLGVLAVGLPQR